MADINFGILDTQMPGRIAAIPQQQQAQQAQNAMQLMQVQQSMGQNELAKYQLSAAQRADQTQNAINKAYQNAIGPNGQIDYAAVRRALAAGGAGSAIPKLESERLTAEKLAAQTRASTTTADRTNFELTNLKIDRARTSIAAAPNSEAALAAINKNLAAGNIDAEDAGILIKDLGDSATFAEGKARVLKTMLSAKDQLAQQAIKTVDTDRGGFIERQTYDAQGIAVGNPIKLPKTAAPSTDAAMLSASIRFNPETGAFQNVAPAGMSMRSPAAGAIPQGFPAGGGVPPTAAPVAVGGNAMIPSAQPSVNAMRPGAAPTAAPAATSGYSPRMLREMAAKGMQPDGKGGQTFIPGGEKDPAAMARLEAAKAEGTATGRDTVAAIRTLPNAIASSQKALANIDAMLGDARVVNNQIVATQGKGPHPGFSSAVGAGIGLRFIPGTPAADFQERFREVTSGAFLEAFESLRGGGSITEKEGEKATAAKTRMSLAQSEKEFVTAAREYQSIIRDGVKRAQSRLSKAQSTSALGNVVDFGDLK